ncbi:MAG TPA: molecular chaperone Hsp20 [Pseudomonas sp.]|nr:molecular chaperone Hsp20 [Pseudomonas sp.]
MNDAANKPVAGEEKKAAPPATHEPWRPFESLRRQVDRLFDDFDLSWHRPLARTGVETGPFWQSGLARLPAVDVVEKDDAFEISAELPGMDEKDVEVKLSGNTLTIKGEKRQERKEEKQGYYLSERSYGSFQRSFNVPDSAEKDKIQARFNKGVLMLSMPKKPGAADGERTIAVSKD